MTDNTHGQVPAIQRYKIGYHSDEWGVRSPAPQQPAQDDAIDAAMAAKETK